jgi:hypothetical protein
MKLPTKAQASENDRAASGNTKSPPRFRTTGSGHQNLLVGRLAFGLGLEAWLFDAGRAGRLPLDVIVIHRIVDACAGAVCPHAIAQIGFLGFCHDNLLSEGTGDKPATNRPVARKIKLR